jgi:protein-disulfide isomerase
MCAEGKSSPSECVPLAQHFGAASPERYDMKERKHGTVILSILIAATGAFAEPARGGQPATTTVLSEHRAANVADSLSALSRKIDTLEKSLNARFDRLEKLLSAHTAPPAGSAARPPADSPNPDSVYSVSIGKLPAFGTPQAPATLVVFYDYRCSYCRSVSPLVKQLKEEYGEKLRVIYVANPIISKAQGQAACRAALAAHMQGKFREMHDVIFQDPDHLDSVTMARYAVELSLDTAKFRRAVVSKEVNDVMAGGIAEAQRIKITAVPAFLLNGRYFDGAQTYAYFKARIDEGIGAKRQ